MDALDETELDVRAGEGVGDP
jgi:hypothetical protein